MDPKEFDNTQDRMDLAQIMKKLQYSNGLKDTNKIFVWLFYFIPKIQSNECFNQFNEKHVFFSDFFDSMEVKPQDVVSCSPVYHYEIIDPIDKTPLIITIILPSKFIKSPILV